jgi:hypothetical protein
VLGRQPAAPPGWPVAASGGAWAEGRADSIGAVNRRPDSYNMWLLVNKMAEGCS